jgi:hypothetical protein
MTVSATVPRVQYTITSANVTSLASDSSSVTFPVTFKYLATSEVVATKTSSGTETVLTEITHYTVSAAGASGTFTFTDAGAALFAADDTLTFNRKMQRTSDTFDQLSDYAQNDALDADTLENNFDKAIMIAQQLLDAADRRLHFSDATTFETTAVAAAQITATKTDRASKYLGFDANGDIVTLTSLTGLTFTEAGVAAGHIMRYTGSVWTNSNILALDDTKLYFGTDRDTSIEWDTTDTALQFQANVEGQPLSIGLYADEGDDNIDKWKLNVADGGVITFNNKASGSFVSQLTITPHATVASSSILAPGRLYFSDIGGEYIYGDGTDLYLVSSADINIPTGIGLTFGNDGEKIEGNGTKLDIAASELDFSIEAGGDINIGADIGLTFGNDGEKIEGDGTNLTIASSASLNLNTGSGTGNDLKINTSQLVLEGDNGNLTVDTDTLYVDAANEKVGINKTPATEFHAGGIIQLEDKAFAGGHTRTSSLVNVNIGNDSTYASGAALLQIKNVGNRGAKGDASGSDLLRGDFSDANGFIFDRSGNLDITGSYNSGTIGTGVVFPAGTVLQVKNHFTANGQGSTSNGLINYIQSDGTFATGSTSPWGNLTIKKANSTLVFLVTTSPYFDDGIVSSSIISVVRVGVHYSTNSDLSSSTTTSNIIVCYEDCRSTMNVSGQQQGGAAGSIAVTTSYAKDTVVYYTLKTTLSFGGIYESTCLQVLEVAT